LSRTVAGRAGTRLATTKRGDLQRHDGVHRVLSIHHPQPVRVGSL
jgi:hypothetical protein